MMGTLLDKFETELENKFIDFEFKQLDNDNAKIFNLLKKKIKNENNNYGCCLFKKISSNVKVICFIDKKTNELVSFIWFGIYHENKIINIDKYIHINFSYTFEAYRNLGLNKKLRLWIETYCLENKINYIISIPLPGSNSENILIKLGYKKKDTYYIKKIF